MNLLWAFYSIYTPQITGNAQKVFFGPFLMKFQKCPYNKNYISDLIFQNEQRGHLSNSV